MPIRKALSRAGRHRLLYRADESGVAGAPKRRAGEILARGGPLCGRALERLARQVAFP